MRYLLIMLLILVSGECVVTAQDSLRTRYGVQGGLLLNMHSASFRKLPGVPNCCEDFKSGTGNTPFASLSYQTPIGTNLLFGAALSYLDHSATLDETQAIRVIVNGIQQDGAFDHRLKSTLSSIGIEPFIGYRPFGNLLIHVGTRAGIMISKTFSQREEISQPSNSGTFLDSNGNDSRSRIRNQFSGDIPDANSVLLHGIVGISYELPMNSRGTILLAPSVQYALGLNDVVQGLSWKPTGIKAGVSVLYSPRATPPKKDLFDTLYVRDTTSRDVDGLTAPVLTLLDRKSSAQVLELDSTIEHKVRIEEDYRLDSPAPKKLDCDLHIVGVDANGIESPLATLKVEEFLSTNAFPLLTFIFFPEGSAEIPTKYTLFDPQQAKRFAPESLFGQQTLDIYYSVMNIIGHRLNEYPNAVLTITGCNADMGAETKNLSLSTQRAERVRDYFKTTWNVADSRLKLASRDLPEKPSNPATPIGQEENRRVEITCNVPDVLDVFIGYDTVRVSNPPIIRFKPTATAPKGIKDWKLNSEQVGKSLIAHDGQGDPTPSIDWDLANQQNTVPRYDQPVNTKTHVASNDGQVCDKLVSIPTEVVTLRQKRSRNSGDYRIEKFSLVLFEFGRSAMTAAQQRVINMIKQQIVPKSELLIEGYTDKSGTLAGNERLATARAQSTRDAIGRKDATVRGIGASRLLYPNNTPEGRFYCRTVQITVKTPVTQ